MLILAFACINIAFLSAFTGEANEDIIIDELDAVPVSNLFITIPDTHPLYSEIQKDQLMVSWRVKKTVEE